MFAATTRAVFPTCATPVAGTTLSIFDIARQLYSNPASKQYEAYKICDKVKAVKDRYDLDLADLNTKQLIGLISKYIIGPAVRGKKTPQQVQLETEFTGLATSNNALIDGLMAHIDRGIGIVSPPTNLVETFFGKFNGNFGTWLKGKIRVDTEIDQFISAIEHLTIRDILSDDGHTCAIFAKYGITPAYALDIVIFIRKVFILSEFHNTPIYKVSPPSMEITSDQIISILTLHCTIQYKSPASPLIYIMDQVCRVCHSAKCKHDHAATLGFKEVTTPKTSDEVSITSKTKHGGKSITKKRRFTNITNKKVTYTCKKYKVKVKKCKRTRRRHH